MRKPAMGSIALAAVLLLTGAAAVSAAEPVGPKLTPKLRDLLRQEMASVLLASQDILGALNDISVGRRLIGFDADEAALIRRLGAAWTRLARHPVFWRAPG